jgi:acetyl esterase/lipase
MLPSGGPERAALISTRAAAVRSGSGAEPAGLGVVRLAAGTDSSGGARRVPLNVLLTSTTGRVGPRIDLFGAGRVGRRLATMGARPVGTRASTGGDMMRTGGRRHGRRRSRPAGSGRARSLRALCLVLCALVLAGCAGTIERGAEGAVEEWTEGPFYRLPDPLPAGAPGEVVRSEPIDSAPPDALAWRVLYHSTDLDNTPILVSGVVVAPRTPAPPGGRTVVSWGHPTTGIAQRCAPSVGIDPFDLIEGLRDLLAAGYVVAATDYPGMGAAGPGSYLVGETAGRSVLDAARAARALEGTGAGSRLLLWGHSQGGHAALFAAQIAPVYAPELQLLGVATAAPAAELAELLDADIGDVSGVTISAYAFATYASVYRDPPGATLDTILTPAGAAVTPAMAPLCLFGQNRQLHELAQPLIGKYLAADPSTRAPWAALLQQNTPGAAKLTVPLFVAQGGSDTLVRPETTARFVARECGLGTHVTTLTVPSADHGLIAPAALPTVIRWFAGVVDGSPGASSC